MQIQIVILFFIIIAFCQILGLRHVSKLNQPVSKFSFTNSFIKTLLIDNYDSYTYNLYQLLSRVNGIEPQVIFNNQFNSWNELINSVDSFDNIIISPGPGTPTNSKDFGISMDAIKYAEVPILGVCLGHQGIGHCFGGKVKKATEPMHGRLSAIKHDNSDLFYNIPQDFNVVRYHSLIIEDPMPSELMKTAWTTDGIIMGLKHKTKPIYGVQFHPESICTQYGEQLIENFKLISFLNKKSKNSMIIQSKLSFINENKPKPITQQRHIHISTINTTKDNLEMIFETIYSNLSANIWLDSSSDHIYEINKPLTFSIMTGLEHKNDYSIEYLGNNQLIKRENWENKNEPKIITLNENIFEFLSKQIENEKSIETIYNYENNNHCNISFLPLNITEMLFGYLSYELRETTKHLLTKQQSNQSNIFGKYNLTIDNNMFTETKWINQLNHPLAVFLKPTQLLLFDHQTNLLYVISLTTINTSNNSINETLVLKQTNQKQNQLLNNKIQQILFQKITSTSTSTSTFELDLQNELILLENIKQNNFANNLTLISNKSEFEYKNLILKCIELIQQGQTYEICLTSQFRGIIHNNYENNITNNNSNNNKNKNNNNNNNNNNSKFNFRLYKLLRKGNSAPYSSYFHYNPLNKYTLNDFDRNISSLYLNWTQNESNESIKTNETNEFNENKSNKFIQSNETNIINIMNITNNNTNQNGFTILCSSPERFIKSNNNRNIETKPIKGTAKKNIKNNILDNIIIHNLMNDEKSIAENLMIVDLLRNDFGRICEINSINVTKLISLESYHKIHQLVTTINGKIRNNCNIIDVFVSIFPGGSMTGAPKIRTMEIIDEFENHSRGIYSGAIGYIGLNGICDFNIVIRTALITNQNITIAAGGAIIMLSEPQKVSLQFIFSLFDCLIVCVRLIGS